MQRRPQNVMTSNNSENGFNNFNNNSNPDSQNTGDLNLGHQKVPTIGETVNPLFVDCLRELMRNCEYEKLRVSYRKALDSILVYPLPLRNGNEAQILKGIGPGVAKRIDDYLRSHGIDPYPPELLQKQQEEEKNAQEEESASQNSQKTAQKKKKPKKPYHPQLKSAPWAMLFAMYRADKQENVSNQENPPNPEEGTCFSKGLSKTEIVRLSSPYTDTQMLPGEGSTAENSTFCGWNSMGVSLISKGLVIPKKNASGHRTLYYLTKTGRRTGRSIFRAVLKCPSLGIQLTEQDQQFVLTEDEEEILERQQEEQNDKKEKKKKKKASKKEEKDEDEDIFEDDKKEKTKKKKKSSKKEEKDEDEDIFEDDEEKPKKKSKKKEEKGEKKKKKKKTSKKTENIEQDEEENATNSRKRKRDTIPELSGDSILFIDPLDLPSSSKKPKKEQENEEKQKEDADLDTQNSKNDDFDEDLNEKPKTQTEDHDSDEKPKKTKKTLLEMIEEEEENSKKQVLEDQIPNSPELFSKPTSPELFSKPNSPELFSKPTETQNSGILFESSENAFENSNENDKILSTDNYFDYSDTEQNQDSNFQKELSLSNPKFMISKIKSLEITKNDVQCIDLCSSSEEDNEILQKNEENFRIQTLNSQDINYLSSNDENTKIPPKERFDFRDFLPKKSQKSQKSTQNDKILLPFSDSDTENSIFDPISKTHFEVVLCVDTRERSGGSRTFFYENLSKLCKCEQVQLNLGDFLWIIRNSASNTQKFHEFVLDFVIERKTIEDLASSLVDGRWNEQKFRMHNSGIKNCFYLVEGVDKEKEIQKLASEGQLNAAIANTLIKDGFFLKRTENVKESLNFLVKFTKNIIFWLKNEANSQKIGTKTSFERFLLKNGEDFYSLEDYNEIGSKNFSLTVKEVFGRQLRIIPQCSAIVVESILMNFPTIRFLFSKYDETTIKKKEELLKDIYVLKENETENDNVNEDEDDADDFDENGKKVKRKNARNSNRRIGPSLSKSIYQSFS